MTLEPYLRSPADLGIPYQEVEIDSESGFKLRGWYTAPPDPAVSRYVIFVHGANSSRFQALESLPYWHARGYGLLSMDLSGRGSSEGDYITYSVNERHDVVSMYRWMKLQPGAGDFNIVIFGTSNGAASAIYAASSLTGPAALVLDAPYSALWPAAREMLASRGVSPELVHVLRWPVRWRAGVEISEVRPLDVIGLIQAPTLFIHGDADRQVPPYHSQLLHQARLNRGLPSERWVIPGGEHGFDNYPAPLEFWNRVIDWCQSFNN